jgi:hypothetical protein
MAVAALGLLAMPSIGNAACAAVDGNGAWDIYSTVVTGTPGWNRCSANVTNGAVSGSCTTHAGATSTIRGTLSIAGNCRVSGSITHTFAGGRRYTVTIAQATLGANDDVIMGVARSSTGQALTFQGIRR